MGFGNMGGRMGGGGGGGGGAGMYNFSENFENTPICGSCIDIDLF